MAPPLSAAESHDAIFRGMSFIGELSVSPAQDHAHQDQTNASEGYIFPTRHFGY